MATVFTDAGENHVADVFDGTVAAPANYYVDWGTGWDGVASSVSDASKDDTALVTPGGEARVAATKSQPATNQNRNVGTMTASGAKTINEAGLFTASTAGTMVIRGTFTGIALAANDKIELTFDLTWS